MARGGHGQGLPAGARGDHLGAELLGNLGQLLGGHGPVALRRHGDDLVRTAGPATWSSPRLSLSAITPMMATFRWETNSSKAWRSAWEQPGLWPPSSSTRGCWEMTSIRAGMKAFSKPAATALGSDGPAAVRQHLQHLQGGDSVFHLVLPQKGRAQRHVPPGGCPPR